MDALLGEYRELAERAGRRADARLGPRLLLGGGAARRSCRASLRRPPASGTARTASTSLWGPGIVPAPGHPHRGGAAQVCRDAASRSSACRADSAWPSRCCRGVPAPSGKAVHYAEHYRPAAPSPPRARESDAEAIEKLKALGYIGAGEAAVGARRGAGSTRTAGSWNNEGLVLRAEGQARAASPRSRRRSRWTRSLGSALWNLSDVLEQQKRDADRSDALLVRAFATRRPRDAAIPDRARDRVPEGRRRGAQPAAARRGARGARRRARGVAVPRPLPRRGRATAAARSTDFRRATALAPAHAAAYASEGLALPVPRRPRGRPPQPRALAPARPRPAPGQGVPGTALVSRRRTMSRHARLAVVAMLRRSRCRAAGRRTRRATRKEAIKHYRAGKDALAHERFDEAEQEFRLADEARSAPRRRAPRPGPDDDGDEALPRGGAMPSVAAREAFNQGQAAEASNEMATQRRLDDQIKALQDDVTPRSDRRAGPNASASRPRSTATRTRSRRCSACASGAATGRSRRRTGCRLRSAAPTSARATW